MRFIKERNKLLVCFLRGVSGLEFSVESEQIQYAFASTLEMCYYLRNLNLVLPHCFLGNLAQSRISGFKSVSVVNGTTSSGGGYQTLRSWLELHGTEPLQCGKSTIDIFFDNIGNYVIKNYQISTEKIKTADIITTCMQIVVDDKTDILSTDFHIRYPVQNCKQSHIFHKYIVAFSFFCLEKSLLKKYLPEIFFAGNS